MNTLISLRKMAFIAIALLMFTSCKTSFRISVQEPAVIKINPNATQFALVNSVTMANSPEDIAGNILGGQSPDANVIASERAVDGALRALDRTGRMKGTFIETDSLYTMDGSVNWDFIDDFCERNNLHGVMEIAELKTVSPVGGTVLATVEGRSKTRLDGTAFMNYYIAGTHESHQRFRVSYRYNIPLAEGESIVDILTNIQRKREYYRKLGFELGYKAGKLMYPNWVWVNRQYYNKGSDELKRAKPMIHKGNWDIAEKQLERGKDHHKDKVRGRVYFNLALVKEGQGDLDKAIEYAEIASLEYGEKLSNEYLVKLRRRKRQMEIIKEDTTIK